MDMTDRKLLNLIQGPFPMVEQPYLNLAEQLETTEEDVLAVEDVVPGWQMSIKDIFK